LAKDALFVCFREKYSSLLGYEAQNELKKRKNGLHRGLEAQNKLGRECQSLL
jgi:hypothetical protein